jgi:enoyl-CoA hydratase/carnithine racemase
LDRPVIGEISGDLIGESLEIALACDIRVAAKSSHFGLDQVKMGVIPCDGGTQRLSRIIGKANAMEILLTGDVIEAQEALRVGLMNRIVEPDKLSETVEEMAQEMASKGPIALRYAKEATDKGMDLTLEQGLRLEADLYFLLHTTKDRTEGIRAFQEKRRPNFEAK